jgi:DNA repair protein RadC
MNEKNKTLKMPITEWAVSDRPREKYLANGFDALSDSELIAILLRSGTPEQSAVDLSKSLLKMCNQSLNKLSLCTLADLLSVHGIGHAKALTILTAFELGKRCRVETVKEADVFRSATAVFELMQAKLSHLKHEEFWAIFLDSGAHLISMERVAQGGLNQVQLDTRILLQQALAVSASAIILCHNHPSGKLKPSPADLQLTQQVSSVCTLMNISLLDHVIIGKEEFFSFANEGMV